MDNIATHEISSITVSCIESLSPDSLFLLSESFSSIVENWFAFQRFSPPPNTMIEKIKSSKVMCLAHKNGAFPSRLSMALTKSHWKPGTSWPPSTIEVSTNLVNQHTQCKTIDRFSQEKNHVSTRRVANKITIAIAIRKVSPQFTTCSSHRHITPTQCVSRPS